MGLGRGSDPFCEKEGSTGSVASGAAAGRAGIINVFSSAIFPEGTAYLLPDSIDYAHTSVASGAAGGGEAFHNWDSND